MALEYVVPASAALLLIGALRFYAEILSMLTDATLRLIYNIPHRKDVGHIPTVPFRWPNGQGTEKFFHGSAAAQQWRRKYGRIYRIWSGFRPEIVLTQPHQVEEYFRDSHKHVKAKNNNSGWLFGEVLGECVGLLSLHEWRDLRKYVEAPFSRPSAQKHSVSICEQATDYVDSINIGVERQIDPAIDLQFYPFMVVANILFGPLSPQQRDELIDLAPLREELFREVIRGGVNRLWIAPYMPWSGNALLQKFQNRWLAFVEKSYSKALTESPTAPIVELWQGIEDGKVTKRQALQTLDESLYANLDVTTSAISWNIILLAQHPTEQEMLRKEAFDNSTSLEEYVNRSGTFVAAAVLEASRLRPILAFSNPEAATVDKLIDGYVIPCGTNVIVDSAAINIDNPFWSDGRLYRPQRHTGLKSSEVRYNLWRFGFGPRQCLGQHVADRMLRAIMVEMVKRYDLSMVDPDASGIQDESWVGLPSVKVKCRVREDPSK